MNTDQHVKMTRNSHINSQVSIASSMQASFISNDSPTNLAMMQLDSAQNTPLNVFIEQASNNRSSHEDFVP